MSGKPNTKFLGTKETLNALSEKFESKEPGIYQRFGDGDLNLALGVNDMLQVRNPMLERLMRDAFAYKAPNILKTLPHHCKEWGTHEEGMFPGNHEGNGEWCGDAYNKFRSLIGQTDEDYSVYSTVALCHQATVDPLQTLEWLKGLKKSNVPLLIGNEDISPELVKKLFNENTFHVKTPSSQSFSKFDETEKQSIEVLRKMPIDEFGIVVTSMGCTGRALQFTLFKKLVLEEGRQLFFFDFGSLMDAFMHRNTRAWIELTNFDPDVILNGL